MFTLMVLVVLIKSCRNLGFLEVFRAPAWRRSIAGAAQRFWELWFFLFLTESLSRTLTLLLPHLPSLHEGSGMQLLQQ